MLRFPDFYRMKKNDDLGDLKFWNPRLQDIDLRLNEAEGQFGKFDKAAQEVITAGIGRIDHTLQPAINDAQTQVINLTAQTLALQNQVISDSANLTSQLNALITTANDLIAGLSSTSIFNSGTFATPLIKLISLYSTVPGATPALGIMDAGRLAINVADEILFYKSADGLSVKSINMRNPTLGATAAGVTQAPGDSTTKLSTTAFVNAALAAILGPTVPANMNTLDKISAALGDDPAFATTLNAFLVNLIRFDQAQTLNPAQLAQVQANIGLGTGSYAYYGMADAAVIAVDFNNGFNQSVTLGGNRALGPPQNIVVGTSGIFKINQGAGGRTLTFNNAAPGPGFSGWSFDADTAPVIGTIAGRESYLSWHAKTTQKVLVGLAATNVTP